MEATRTPQRQRVFPFMRFPLEIRRRIYTFAAMRKLPIEVKIKYHGGAPTDNLALSRVRLYPVEDFDVLRTNHEFRREMIGPLHEENAFDIVLSNEGVDLSLFRLDILRIKRCRLLIHDMETTEFFPRIHVWGGSFPLYWYHHLRSLMATLVLNKHQIEFMLVECARQSPTWLLECLRPMALLRHVGMIHFRSSSAEVHPYFRFLERLIMSEGDVPCKNRQEFRDQTRPWRARYDSRFPQPPGGGPPHRITDMTGEVIEESEEQMETMAELLYEILGIEDEMIPQEDL